MTRYAHPVQSRGATGGIVVALGLSIASTGCGASYAAMSCPDSTTPVMLGPVDRVDGHRRERAAPLATIDVESSSSVVNGRTYFRWRATPPDLATRAVLAATRGRPDADVQLTRVDAGAWFFVPIIAARNERWVRVHGDAVRAFK